MMFSDMIAVILLLATVGTFAEHNHIPCFPQTLPGRQNTTTTRNLPAVVHCVTETSIRGQGELVTTEKGRKRDAPCTTSPATASPQSP